jgi:uncharacterized protein (DUF697 family)/GTP-binding protein EngB required for normal cell division
MDPAVMFQEYQNRVDEAASELGAVNVLVAGMTGVGKSSLINAVFGARVARTGIGRPVTRNVEEIRVPGMPLVIYDTRGFEIKESEETIAAVDKKLDELRRSTDEANQIHIAWLCILEQSHRVEEVHESFLKTVEKHAIPAVVVLTQAYGERAMLDTVARIAGPKNIVIPVMAQAKKIGGQLLKPYGVDFLVERTYQLLPEAQRAAFVAAQTAKWDLKEAAVRAAIKRAVIEAGATAPIPGHSAILIPIQLKMIAEINSVLGLSIRKSDDNDFIKGLIGIFLAQVGGKAAFGLAFSEALKLIPGLGWAGASVIGGGIAATITRIFGNVYFDSVQPYARQEAELPSQEELLSKMTVALREGKKDFGEEQ